MIRLLLSRRMLVTLSTGFSSGLPLLLTGSTLQAWMTDEGVDLAVIGIFSLVGLPYALKFLWAPLMDRWVPPYLGRRRGWTLLTQILLVGSIFLLGMANPAANPGLLALMAVLVTFFSASQDIVLDAYRRELLVDEELGLGSSVYINGYRIAMLASGGGALFLADVLPWSAVYAIMALCMIFGIITTFIAPDPPDEALPPKTLKEAVVEPFVEYFRRDGALVILTFILLYKIGDTMAAHMTTPFFLGEGFTKSEIAAVVKSFGLIATIGGAFAGGLMMLKWGIHRALWIFGGLQMVSTAGFAILALYGKSMTALAAVIGIENVCGGMGTSAYAAYMASITNKRFTATQYALLTSLMGVPRVIAAAPTGYLAKEMGWVGFFVFCTLIALPGMWLLTKVAPWKKFGTI